MYEKLTVININRLHLSNLLIYKLFFLSDRTAIKKLFIKNMSSSDKDAIVKRYLARVYFKLNIKGAFKVTLSQFITENNAKRMINLENFLISIEKMLRHEFKFGEILLSGLGKLPVNRLSFTTSDLIFYINKNTSTSTTTKKKLFLPRIKRRKPQKKQATN
jgi:hypothetical protein